MNRPIQMLDYCPPTQTEAQRRKGVLSLILGCAAAMMTLLFLAGVFWNPALLLPALFVTTLLSIMGLILAFEVKFATRPAFWGASASVTSEFIVIFVVISFFSSLKIC